MNVVPHLRRKLLGVGVVSLGVLCLTPAAPAALAGVPPLYFTPSYWDFGPIAANTTTSKTFTLTNATPFAQHIYTSVHGSEVFTKAADTCDKRNLGGGETCSVTIQYAPARTGERDTERLSARGSGHTEAYALLHGGEY